MTEQDISSIVAEITTEYETAQGKVADAVTSYVKIGARLTELKACVKAKLGAKWQDWVDNESDLPFKHHQASKYMAAAKRHAELVQKAPSGELSARSLNDLLAMTVDRPKTAKIGKARPRPRQRRETPDGEPYEFDTPDLAHQVHHLAQQWPAAEVERYAPGDAQMVLLDEDLPPVVTALVELAERCDIDIPVRAVEGKPSFTINGEGRDITDAVLLEAPVEPGALARLQEAWNAASEDERAMFVVWARLIPSEGTEDEPGPEAAVDEPGKAATDAPEPTPKAGRGLSKAKRQAFFGEVAAKLESWNQPMDRLTNIVIDNEAVEFLTSGGKTRLSEIARDAIEAELAGIAEYH